jgi:hypothetical protein
VEAALGDWHDANWLRCNITFHAGIKHSIEASLLTTELGDLSNVLSVASTPGADAELTFEPLEPYVELRVKQWERQLNVLARLDLHPALGPVIEFNFECRPEELVLTVSDIEELRRAFPERNV